MTDIEVYTLAGNKYIISNVSKVVEIIDYLNKIYKLQKINILSNKNIFTGTNEFTNTTTLTQLLTKTIQNNISVSDVLYKNIKSMPYGFFRL